MGGKLNKAIVTIIVLSTICCFLTLGVLIEQKTVSNDTEIISTQNNIENNSTKKPIFINTETTLGPKATEFRIDFDTSPNNASQTSSETQPEQSIFQVTTDFGYICTAGDPKLAIQNAIDSLPEQRTESCNVYLKGIFYPVSSIIMKDNVNFVGDKATLISENDQPIFVHDWEKNYSEPLGSGDWITLNNVTFTSIYFKNTIAYNDQASSAIYFYDGNSTGWGVSNNLSVYDCQFEGFYNCIQGLAIYSNYTSNYFHNYLNNAIMFPAGFELIIKDNIFDTPSNELTVEQYQERDGPMSIQGGIAIFFMDVSGDVSIVNNTFVEGTNTTGITFSSSVETLW